MRTRLAVHLLAVMSLASFVYAGEPDPKQILDKVAAQYESLQAEAEGTVVTDIETGRGSMHMETSFSMKLKKPNLYLITWTQKGMPMSGMEQSGAVWNAGAQPCLYMGIMKAYSKMTSDEIALGAATGISGGAAFTIPWLFFSVLGPKHGAILQLADPKIEKIEKLDGEECYVVSGSSPISRKETFWISTRRLLILQFSRSLEPPAGRPAQQDLTDKELDEAIKGLGQEPTPEARATMKEILKQGQETLKNAKIKGTSCEHHLKISSPQLSQADFQFKVPEGTALEDSLFNLNMGEGTRVPRRRQSPATTRKPGFLTMPPGKPKNSFRQIRTTSHCGPGCLNITPRSSLNPGPPGKCGRGMCCGSLNIIRKPRSWDNRMVSWTQSWTGKHSFKGRSCGSSMSRRNRRISTSSEMRPITSSFVRRTRRSNSCRRPKRSIRRTRNGPAALATFTR